MEIELNYTEINYDFFHPQVCGLQEYLFLVPFRDCLCNIILLLLVQESTMTAGNTWPGYPDSLYSGSTPLFLAGLQLEPLT